MDGWMEKERERDIKRERERESESEGERGRGTKREKDRERKKDDMMMFIHVTGSSNCPQDILVTLYLSQLSFSVLFE